MEAVGAVVEGYVEGVGLILGAEVWEGVGRKSGAVLGLDAEGEATKEGGFMLAKRKIGDQRLC